MSKINICLGFDPGKFNTGWAIYHKNKGLLHSGIVDGLGSVEDISIVETQVRRLFRNFKPHVVGVERFHSQYGRGSKKNFELINILIGIIVGKCISRKIPYKLVTASAHKRWIVRQFPDDIQMRPVKDRGRGRIKRKFDITTYPEWAELDSEHEADAANVAKYVIEHFFVKR